MTPEPDATSERADAAVQTDELADDTLDGVVGGENNCLDDCY